MQTYLVVFLLVIVVSAEEYHHFPPTPRDDGSLGSKEDFIYWKVSGQVELEIALRIRQNNNKAKNVILFIGDGMSLNTVTAARIMYGQRRNGTGENELLSFEKFPYSALIKTYNVDMQVPDSAGTATAFLTGVKTSAGVLGVDGTVPRGDCSAVNERSKLESIINWFQDANKKTGIVTTTRITHATPAAGYANSAHRNWECDDRISSSDYENCPDLKDIAMQLVEDAPGNRINVILGGGLKHFDGSVTGTPDDPVSGCVRKDGRQLVSEWLLPKENEEKYRVFVKTKLELLAALEKKPEYLMGLFANSHLPYDYEIRKNKLDVPSLKEMTKVAIEALQQNGDDNGFFLLVEGGRIDHAHHEGRAQVALEEAIAFSDAIASAVEMVDTRETLIIATADHSHTLTVNGYPSRGNPILGIAGEGKDGKSYTTLMYSNGPGYAHTDTGGRPDPKDSDIHSHDYKQQSSVPLKSETHGGDDVPLYAIGPMAHLFHSVHEQNYIAHVMAYAACVGDNTHHCEDN